MRKRNKKTTVVCHTELCRLTEYILAGMGEEGQILRARLLRFLAERAVPPRKPGPPEESPAPGKPT